MTSSLAWRIDGTCSLSDTKATYLCCLPLNSQSLLSAQGLLALRTDHMMQPKVPLSPAPARSVVRDVARPLLSQRSAYRRLYRTALQAVRYSTPARYQVRSILRDSFRNLTPAAFSQRRIENTISFLKQAGNHNGYEHKILRNILHVRYWKDNPKKERTPAILKQNDEKAAELRQTIPGHFTATLDMFNESMNLCLRV